MSSNVRVRFDLRWVNGWFIRAFARPLVVVDGHEVEGSWRDETEVDVEPGTVEVAASIRYRGTRTPLGTGTYRAPVSDGEVLHLVARNGVMNQTPFELTPV